MARTRSAGEGTIRQRADGRFEGRLSGVRQVVYGRSRKQVADKLDDLRRDARQGLAAPPARLTVEQHLTTWLAGKVEGQHIRPATERSYEQLIRVHIVPEIGRLKVADLTPALIQRFLDGRVKAGLSRRSVEYIRAILRASFGRRDAAKLMISDARVAKNAPARQQRAHIGREELTQILAAMEGTPIYPLVLTAALTGLRQGELLALQWQDVDLTTGRLVVRHQLQRGRLVEPKTAESRGTLMLPAVVIEALTAVQSEQRACGMITPFVFASSKGAPLDGTNLLHRFQARLEAAGLPRYRWHDLRHATGTILLEEGLGIADVQKQLRHSQIALTANTYTHVTDALNRRAADALQRASERR